MVVSMKANVEASATASFKGQTSMAVQSKMEVSMVTVKKLVAGLLVGSMLLWGLVDALQRRSGIRNGSVGPIDERACMRVRFPFPTTFCTRPA